MRHQPSSQIPAPPSILCFAVVLLCALAALVPSSAGAAQAELRCAEVSFSVNLSPSDTTAYDVFGVLCSRGSLRNKTIQIALHGSTYGHLYWDFPFQPEIYSYVRRATAEGYAVLNLDRIGVGRSDHPPAEAVTIESNAYVVHQIVQDAARRGSGGTALRPCPRRTGGARRPFARLGDLDPGGGHLWRRGRRGADRRVAHRDAGPGRRELLSGEPRSALRGARHPGRLLHHRPRRHFRSIFYNADDPSSFDRRIIRIDEKNKETTTVAELNTAVAGLGFSTGIHVPVLVVVGDSDKAFCNPPSCTASGSLDTEPSFYPADACAEAVAIPTAGHDLNLHYQAPRTYTTMLKWLNRRVGSNTKFPAPSPCG